MKIHPANIKMPNWIFCDMKVSGEPAEITRFVDLHMGKRVAWPPIISPSGVKIFEDGECEEDSSEYFCFNGLIPCPEDVVARGFDSIRSGEPLDGYHWAKKNWGTKCDIWPMKLNRKAIGYTGKDCCKLEFSFETANTPPSNWFSVVTKAFPELNITLKYSSFEAGFGRTINAHGGSAEEHIWSFEEVMADYGLSEEV